jgi:diguanylate cyclase (GGDEF)-like protein
VQSSADEHLLGAFLTRPEEPRTPDTAETAVIDAAVQLAAIAIERSLFEGRLAHEAHHDGLTGLANRTLFGELLEHALARVQRSGSALAVLFCDLDRFKVVNDSLGHDAGDALLTVIADRLERVLRPGDVVARFGGDEFTILCEDLDRSDAAAHVTAVAERVIDAIREPVNIGSENQEQFVSASIGIALAGTGKERPEDLLRDADAAMYRAKERGRGRWELFDQRMRDRAQARHEVENALHRAVARGEFTVYYQPVVALRSGVCIGVEALVRWLHPDRGLLTPGEFLHVADDTGLIIDIGGGVLDQACPEVAQWRRMLADGDEFRLRVNLSGRQLMHPETADLVAGVLARTGLRPDALCIEITETVLVEDLAAGVAAVNALKVLGVRVSVDDFGTGYSALDYLRRFPIDDVKIDRRFVGRLGRAPQDVAIVAAIANLGHALGVTVTAEGVETADQLTALRKLDVDAAQGFLFAPPQPAADLTARLLRPHSWI